MRKPEPFLPLEIKKFKFKDVDDNKYHVFKDEANFTEVVAGSASEAIDKSQVTEPLKVVHYNAKDKPFFNKEDLEEMPTEQPLPANEEKAAAQMDNNNQPESVPAKSAAADSPESKPPTPETTEKKEVTKAPEAPATEST
ncbi:MAG: hypothetical protein K0Q51_1339 [Rickettsiaceae bacterium]|jgi:hypothetical protein|nr:hypothetical protein [Rickettsiaceae bacterium]